MNFFFEKSREIYDLQTASAACSFCTTPLVPGSPLILGCPSSSATHCNARFCNRLCLSRSAKTHPLLCPAQNPASVPLLKFAKEVQWMALHALTQITSRILLAHQQLDDLGVDTEWQFVRALAEIGLEERYNNSNNKL